MYLAAGQAAAKAANTTWDELVARAHLPPLGMTRVEHVGHGDSPATTNVATPHADVNDTLVADPVAQDRQHRPGGFDQLERGRHGQVGALPARRRARSAASARSASARSTRRTPPQMIDPARRRLRNGMNPSAALDVVRARLVPQRLRGREDSMQHGGNIDGMTRAWSPCMPEEKFGMVILTNTNGSPVPTIDHATARSTRCSSGRRRTGTQSPAEGIRQAARAAQGRQQKRLAAARAEHEAVARARPSTPACTR